MERKMEKLGVFEKRGLPAIPELLKERRGE
jgi:hypothetical protein